MNRRRLLAALGLAPAAALIKREPECVKVDNVSIGVDDGVYSYVDHENFNGWEFFGHDGSERTLNDQQSFYIFSDGEVWMVRG